MGFKKGRAVAVAERPLYDHCTRLFLERRICGFWAYGKGEWALQASPENPQIVLTPEEMRDTLRRLDPDGCVWDTGRPRPTGPGKRDFVDLSRRLLNALVEGNRDAELIVDAHELLATT